MQTGRALPAPAVAFRPPLLARLAGLGRLLWKDKTGLVGLLLFSLFVATAVFAPWVAPHDPLKQNLAISKRPPAWLEGGSWESPLGTDVLGRDLLSRIIFGARVSLTVGLLGVLIASVLGMVLGLVAGFSGGRVDAVITTTVNMLLALPYLLFVVFIAGILGQSLRNVVLIFGITDIPLFARLTRGEVLRLRQEAFVEAAHAVGAGHTRILVRHLLPNLVGVLVIAATFEMSAMIFYEAGLGFLGLSVPPTVPSWGNMLALGRGYLRSHWWIATLPGVAIVIASLAVNLLGEWLRDVLDPRIRRRR